METLALSVYKSAVNFGETVVFSISNSTGQDLNQNAYITIQTGEQYSTSVLWNNQTKQYSFTLSFLRPEWGALLMAASSIIVVTNSLLLGRKRI